MSRIALVISDVDGTLVTSQKRLTERSRAAVAHLRTKRHRLHAGQQPAVLRACAC